MTNYRRNKNKLIRHYVWDSLLIILSLTWRSIASIFMSLLAVGAAAGQAGEPHQWFVYFTGIMLFFCPWGSPMRNAFVEEYRQKKMEREGVIFWVTIRQQSCLTSLLLIWADIYINGIFGIILGWKYFLKLVFDLIDNIQRIKALL